MPATSGRALFVPQPDASVQHFDSQLPFRGISQGLLLPSRRRLPLDPLAHFDRVRVALIIHAWAAKTGFLRRQVQLGIVRINVPIRVNVRYKDLALIFQRLQQRKRLSVSPIDAHPLEANPAAAGVKHDLKCQFDLGFVDTVRFRNICLVAAAPILRPFFGQVQSRIDQADSICPTEGAKTPTWQLSCLPRRPFHWRATPTFLAFLLKGALIHVQSGADFAANAVIGIHRHLVHHAAIVPARVGQEILQHLLIAVRHRFGHALHVSLLRLHQTEQVLPRRRGDIMIARAETWIKRLREFLIPPADVIERAVIAYPILRFSGNLHFILFAISKQGVFKSTQEYQIPHEFHTFKRDEVELGGGNNPWQTAARVLDDERFPLVLVYEIPGYGLKIRYTKISYPTTNEMEKQLSVDKRVDVYGIYFDFASDHIRPESAPILEEIAGLMKHNPDWKLSINGHTDNVGGDASNLELSRQRAKAVKAALVERYGIAENRLNTGGFGASQPHEKNDTPEGRSRNRRVELTRQ